MGRFTGLFLLAVGIFGAWVGLYCIFLDFAGLGSQGIARFGLPTLGDVGIILFSIILALIIVGLIGPRMARSASTSNSPAEVPETREIDGNAFEVLYQKRVVGRGGSPSSLRLRVSAKSPTTLQFNKETGFDRFCKGIGIAREHQTGDISFDDAVYIRGPSFGYAEQYLKDSEKRAAILGLLALGFNEVRLTGTDIEAVWPKFNPMRDSHPENAAPNLFTLAKQVPADDPDVASARIDWRRVWTLLLWLFALGWAATLTFAYFFEPIRVGRVVLPALTLFALAYPLFLLSAAFLLRGASTSHDRWAPLVGFGLILIGPGSFGTVAAVNGLSDDSPPVTRRLIVLDKRISTWRTGRGSTSKSYYATVADWDRPGETIDVKLSLHEYPAILTNWSHLLLTTSPGRLGIEWLQSLQVQP
jgi:hypothetical protein